MDLHGDTWENVVSSEAPDDDSFDREFDSGFGSTEGHPFCVWTTSRVYFPIEYDGAEGVVSVSRNPDGKVVNHCW